MASAEPAASLRADNAIASEVPFPSDALSDSEPTIVPTPRKRLRLLCLHGFRTSGRILEQQLARWDASLHQLLDLTFLDAPFPCRGKSDVEGIFPPPFYEWFQYNIIFTEYTGLEPCIEYISNYMHEHGPFDGLLGFSQGAVLSAALAGLQQQRLVLSAHPPIRFVILISGAMFKHPKWKQDCYAHRIACPSLHFIGAKDWLKPKNEELVGVFESPTVVRHEGKHCVPRLDEAATRNVAGFLQRMAEEGENRDGGGYDGGHQYDDHRHRRCVDVLA